MKYTQIPKLAEMLTKAGIPFQFEPHTLDSNGYHLCYPRRFNFYCSAIQTYFSYGHTSDLIEVMLDDEDEIIGNLTAEEVYAKIVDHYKKHPNYKEGIN